MAVAPSTNRNYTAALQTYELFCNSHTFISFPTTQSVLVLYATHLANYSSYSNIKRHMASIKYFSTIKGYNNDFHLYHRLYLLLRGIRWSQGTKYNKPKRLPITPVMLRCINTKLFNSSRLYEDKVMLWTAIVVAFFGFLRVSEYTSQYKNKYDPSSTLLISDISCSDKSANLLIKASKTDPFRQGVTVRLMGNNTLLCPINAIRTFLKVRPSNQGPLFTYKDGSFLTRSDVNKVLKNLTNNKVSISSHSLRIGAASTAAATGSPEWLIKGMGRWVSDCYRTYIRIPSSTILSTSNNMASCNENIMDSFDP